MPRLEALVALVRGARCQFLWHQLPFSRHCIEGRIWIKEGRKETLIWSRQEYEPSLELCEKAMEKHFMKDVMWNALDNMQFKVTL